MSFNRLWVSLLFAVCFGMMPIMAEAITFNVDSTVDEVDADPGDGVCATAVGACTLRAAIQESNALRGADTIVLKAKKYYLAIAGTSEDASATGDLDITDHLTIKGVSSAKTIVNGSALDRVFHVNAPVVVKFSNLSIQNGFVQDNGAGIFNVGGAVTLTSCSVANNVSSAGALIMGGGIYSSGAESSLKIQSSSVTNNTAHSSADIAYGGGIGIYQGGTLSISASKIAYNYATATFSDFTQAGGGGIVSLYGSGVTITNSRILANTAMSASLVSFGGGIALAYDSTPAVIRGTTISMNSNTSTGGLAVGGGLYFEAMAATLSSCTIKGNRSSGPGEGGLGGGILANSGADITVNNASNIVSNLASYDGGGIYNMGGTITLSPDSTVANNMPNDQNETGTRAQKPLQLLSR